MSINGVDYTKQLSKEREYFQKANEKLRDSTEKRVADTEKRADHVTNKQKEVFIQDKADLESKYQKNLNEIKDKTSATIEKTNSKSSEQLEKEREDFTKESLLKSKDFDQRLNHIKSSYKKAFDSEKDRNDDLNKNLDEKYQRNVSKLTNEKDIKLKGYQDQMQNANSEMKDQYNRERFQHDLDHQDKLTASYKDAAHKRADLRKQISQDNQKKTEAHKAEVDTLRDYSEERLNGVQKSLEDKVQTMSTDYGQRNDEQAVKNKSANLRTHSENQDKIANMQRDFNNSLRKMNLEKRRADNGSGDFAKVAEEQEGVKERVIHQNKVKHLNHELVDAQRKYQDRASREQDNFNETLKTQATDGSARETKKLNEANAHKLLTVAHEREKADVQIKNRETQNALEKSSYESQLMNERNNSSNRLARLKENFNNSMKTLEEKHKATLEDVTISSNEDKNAFMKKVQEQRSNEIYTMKREFGKMMDATVQDYEQRMHSYERDLEYLKLNSDQKISNLTDQSEKTIQSERKLFEDRRSADIKGQQTLMDQRERQLKKDFAQMNFNYQKKIDKMQVESDTKLKLITNDYESKLKELKASASKETAVKDTAHQNELTRIKQTYEDEKMRLVNAYETQIASMKQGHKEQMSQMAEYKKLS
jgi:hypothetical protein